MPPVKRNPTYNMGALLIPTIHYEDPLERSRDVQSFIKAVRDPMGEFNAIRFYPSDSEVVV